MAQTKIKLIADGAVNASNIASGALDSIINSYLTTNSYITSADETLTSIDLSANILSYTDEAGNTTNLDLSLYLDDTNLARLVSGSLNATTGIATFTRDDASTFTVDFSSLLNTLQVNSISTDTTATKNNLYVLTASLTLTLPASPNAGDTLYVVNRSNTQTPVLARNGSNIMGSAEDFTIDVLNAGIQLTYTDATSGWVIL